MIKKQTKTDTRQRETQAKHTQAKGRTDENNQGGRTNQTWRKSKLTDTYENNISK